MKEWLKTLLECIFNVCTIQLERDSRELKPFDLVSQIENPDIPQLYMIYSIDESDTFFIKWVDYGKKGVFDANLDHQLYFDHKTFSENFFKVTNFTPSASDIFRKLSKSELFTFSKRIEMVFSKNYPSCGWFLDEHGDKWLIVSRDGSLEDGTSVVINLSIAAMITETQLFVPVVVVKTKDLFKYDIHLLNKESFSNLLKTKFHPYIYKLIADYLLSAIKNGEIKNRKFSIYAKGKTTCSQKAQGKEKQKCARCS